MKCALIHHYVMCAAYGVEYNIVSIYHLSAKLISRAKGRSATGAAAYRAGEIIKDERSNTVFDYRKKLGVDYSEIMAPANAPDWVYDRAKLWNAVENSEKRKDSQVARELDVAIPTELNPEQQRDLVRGFARSQFVGAGMVVDMNIHHARSDNPHVHFLMTMRDIGPAGFGQKNRDWNDKALLQSWREAWEVQTNQALESAGHDARIDHRTLTAQGITDRLPGVHLGPAVIAILNRGEHSVVAERVQREVDEFMAKVQADAAIAEAARRDVAELEAQLAQLEAQLQQVIDDQANPKGHAQRLRREIEVYQEQHMAGPTSRLREASDALYNRSHRRAVVEPAHHAVQSARKAQNTAKRVIKESTTELQALPWYRLLRKRELTQKLNEAQERLLPLQAEIDKHLPMASMPIREICEQAVQAALLEIEQVQPGLDALQSELAEVEKGIAEQETQRQAEANRAREALQVAKAQERIKEYAKQVEAWKASPEYKRQQQERQAPAKPRDRSSTPGRG